MTPLDSVLDVRGLTCGYPGKPVLSDLTVAMRSGERVALLGPNGSGKSTLIRAIAGLLPRSGGSVSLGGAPIGSLTVREVARRVATVPQEEVPRFSFTVRQIVTMGRLAQSDGLWDTPEDAEAATRAMTLADCLSLADRPVGELSGGERQRVLIARALAQETPLILLDEPTAHLDPAHQVAVAALVRSLGNDGVASLAAVHDLNFAARMADRALLLADGRIVEDGPVDRVLESPALDAVYGVTFLRARAGGQLILVPQAPFP